MSKLTKKYFVYILEGKDGTFYTGITVNVEDRLQKHNGAKTGGAKYTKTRRPWKLVYVQKCKSRSDALKRECEIKKMSKSEKVSLLFNI